MSKEKKYRQSDDLPVRERSNGGVAWRFVVFQSLDEHSHEITGKANILPKHLVISIYYSKVHAYLGDLRGESKDHAMTAVLAFPSLDPHASHAQGGADGMVALSRMRTTKDEKRARGGRLAYRLSAHEADVACRRWRGTTGRMRMGPQEGDGAARPGQFGDVDALSLARKTQPLAQTRPAIHLRLRMAPGLPDHQDWALLLRTHRPPFRPQPFLSDVTPSNPRPWSSRLRMQ